MKNNFTSKNYSTQKNVSLSTMGEACKKTNPLKKMIPPLWQDHLGEVYEKKTFAFFSKNPCGVSARTLLEVIKITY